MYIVDTDVMIDIQRGYGPALTWFASLPELPSIPGFVVMELIQDAQNKEQVRKVLQLVAPLPIVWPTETDCARALSDFTAYHLSHKVGLIDALIAACTVGRNATLCTFNVKHYQVISGLSMEQPYSR
jgi:predicted nucleic acid-binding protein